MSLQSKRISDKSLIESINFLIKHYLAKFQRNSIRFSKLLEYVYYSLLLLYIRKEKRKEEKKRREKKKRKEKRKEKVKKLIKTKG